MQETIDTKYTVKIVSPVATMSEALDLAEFCLQNEIARLSDGFDNFLHDEHVEFYEC